jgi:hypothetical protein
LAISGPIGEGQRNHFPAVPIDLCPLGCANTIGTAIFTLLTDDSNEYLKKLLYFPLLARQMRCALPIGPASAPHFA